VYGIILGCGAGVLGGFFPLLELVKTDPAQVAQGRTVSSHSASHAGTVALCGIGVLGLSYGVLLLTGRHAYFGLAGSFFLMLGASLLTGIALILVSPLLRRIFALIGGVSGKLAADNIRKNLGRTGVAIAAFMVALSMIVGLGLMIGSFRHSLVWWMESQLHGDLYIATEPEITVPRQFYEEIKDLPGIAAFDLYRNVQITYRDVPVYITAIQADTLQRFADFIWFEGGKENWDYVKGGDIIVSESFHRRFEVETGDRVTVEGKGGPVSLRVAAVFYDYSSEHGVIMMDRATYRKIYGDDTIDSLAVFMDPDYKSQGKILDYIRKGAHAWGLPAISREKMMGNILQVFDTTFAVTRSMRVLAVIVAFFGIAGAILILFIERRKEFGIYRSLGFSTGQVAGMTLLESLGMGFMSFLLSIAAGTAVAIVLIKVINFYSFHWTIFYHHLWGPYLIAGATALVASLGAALYPIFRISRTYPQMQIREE
jgi:putative ABC transport system permease protein